jgi:DNA-3-methyladenine glycosylase
MHAPETDPPQPLLVELPFTVRTYDIDFANHVSNISYIRWLEDLRFRVLEVHYPLGPCMEAGVAPVLTRTEIDYLRAIRLFEPIVGRMWAGRLQTARLELFATFHVGDELCARARQEGVFASLATGRPMRIPAELRRTLLLRRFPDGRTAGGVIVETEAYTGDDPASHSFRGPTARSAVMFGPAGHAYVYFIYGMYHCLNVVCGPEGDGQAVLIRALRPTVGLEVMRSVTGPAARIAGDVRLLRRLTSGPGRICRALGITRAEHDGLDLTEVPDRGEALWLEASGGRVDPRTVVRTPRVGISVGRDRLWRFLVGGDPFISGR